MLALARELRRLGFVFGGQFDFKGAKLFFKIHPALLFLALRLFEQSQILFLIRVLLRDVLRFECLDLGLIFALSLGNLAVEDDFLTVLLAPGLAGSSFTPLRYVPTRLAWSTTNHPPPRITIIACLREIPSCGRHTSLAADRPMFVGLSTPGVNVTRCGPVRLSNSMRLTVTAMRSRLYRALNSPVPQPRQHLRRRRPDHVRLL